MESTYNFDEPVNRIGTDSYKWDMEGKGGKIPLGVADSDFRAPIEVIEVVKKKAEFGVYAYGAFPQERFAEAVSDWYKKRYDVSIELKWICHSQGIMPGALWMLLLALTKQEDTILIQEPVYHNMRIITENMNRRIISSDLVLKGSKYEINWNDLEKKLKLPEVKIFLICSPHNPVGRVWTRDELKRIGNLCLENNVFLISDEVHGDIVYEPYKHTPIIDISDEIAENSAIMSSPSKTFNLAGFYSAYVIIKNDEVRKKYQEVYKRFHFDYNFIGIEALITAYNECASFVDKQNEYFAKNIQIVKHFIKENMPEVKVTEIEGSYLMWLDFRAWKLNPEDLVMLIGNWGVRLNDGKRTIVHI